MEFLGGGTLKRWVTAEKRPWRDVLKVFLEAGRGLAAAHTERLIHRDFKPENVLLDKNDVAKVVDFGLVALSDTSRSPALARIDTLGDGGSDISGADLDLSPATLTRTGALMGTPAYMAPEQFLGKPVDARTDQFAFCASLYEALYGERPFAGDTVAELAKSVTGGELRPCPDGFPRAGVGPEGGRSRAGHRTGPAISRASPICCRRCLATRSRSGAAGWAPLPYCWS